MSTLATTTISSYEQQAIDFLNQTETVLSVKFIKHGKHFADDKESRDIYECELKRGSRSYKFNFGQSLAKSGEFIVKDKNPRFTKTFNKKSDAMNYAGKIGNSFNVSKNRDFNAPTSYDILACITKYNPNTFEDFCSEFGYDTDSKKAEKTYNAVKDEYINVCALFTDKEIEQLQEIN